jgi:hypothetical protein
MMSPMITALEAQIQSILVMDVRTSWPMLAHMCVSDYVVSEASGGGLQEPLANLLRRHRFQMIYYAAAPDGNGITPAFHVYRPTAGHGKGGGVKTIEYWYGCLATMLQAHDQEQAAQPKAHLEAKAAKAAAALSHFCADLSNPVHTVSDDSMHSGYETWLKTIFTRRNSDPDGYGRLYQGLQQQTHDGVTTVRHLLADVATAAVDDLVVASNADFSRLRELWLAKKASHQTFSVSDAELIALSAKRFAAGANFTADVWYTAFEKKGGPLPQFDPYLYSLCPDYDACLKRLDARVNNIMAQAPNQ